MKALLLAPRANYKGNLVWRKAELTGNEGLLATSIKALETFGYWASAYPEGDGVTFDDKGQSLSPEKTLEHFRTAFPWLTIHLATHGDANIELASLESEAETATIITCTAIVPTLKLHFESSFDLGPFHFACSLEFDPAPENRLGDWKGSYIQFNIQIPYTDLLRLNRSTNDNDVVILQCLTMAEHALDLIRFSYSSFKRPEFTPDPAGQLENGLYAVEIVPRERTHLKPVNLMGISRPISASNNWLGPDIDSQSFLAREYFEKILNGSSDELALSVKGALRYIRQAFYSLGDESKFLTLVFALDGLTHSEKGWNWMKHHTYIAALTSHGNINRFKVNLERYEDLYTNVRNALVHNGKDFYELEQNAGTCCEDILGYLKDVVLVIEKFGFTTAAKLQEQSVLWLQTPAYANHIATEVSRLNARDGKIRSVPTW